MSQSDELAILDEQVWRLMEIIKVESQILFAFRGPLFPNPVVSAVFCRTRDCEFIILMLSYKVFFFTFMTHCLCKCSADPIRTASQQIAFSWLSSHFRAFNSTRTRLTVQAVREPHELQTFPLKCSLKSNHKLLSAVAWQLLHIIWSSSFQRHGTGKQQFCLRSLNWWAVRGWMDKVVFLDSMF